jgi:short-subunit dehydrogenase
MNGVSAVLPTFLRQQRGVMINTSSLAGWAPTPFAASYTATKFALRGLSSSLRAELSDHPDIHVCTVFPSLVDTPGLAHGANMSGRAMTPSGPFLSPETVAERMVDLALHPRDEVAVGWISSAVWLAFTVAPALTERVMGAVFRRYLRRAPTAPRTEGAVRAPVPQGTGTTGGWQAREPALLASSVPGWALAGTALLIGTAVALARR